MNVEQLSRFLRTLKLVFTPIVRILLRFNIGYREVTAVLKTTYVDVAAKEYGIRGRPTNASRIAAMTGLTRKEVARIRKDQSSDVANWYRLPVVTIVLDTWHSDPRFLDADGSPATLEYDTGTASFVDLVHRCGGDVPPGAVRTELLRSGAVKRGSNGNLQMVPEWPNSDGGVDALILSMRRGAVPMLSAIASSNGKDGSNSE
jgi:hypothetical protein